MSKARLFGAAFFVCASVSAMMCNVEDTSELSVEETVASQVFTGKVLDPNGAPIVGARVTINGITRLTGSTGSYAVSVADNKAGYHIDIRKNGYGPQTQTLPSGLQGQTHVLQAGFTQSFPGTRAVVVRDQTSGIQVSVPANAFRSSTGIYTGTVRFTIIPHSSQTMPGDFTARNASGVDVALISVGAVTLQAADANGGTLALAPGASLPVVLPVPASAGRKMPDCVLNGSCRTAMWLYNPTTRRWEERALAPTFTSSATGFTLRGGQDGTIDPDNGIGTWNADIEKTAPACTFIEFSNIPLSCYNPTMTSPEPGITVTFNLPGPPVVTVARTVRSSAVFTVIYNIPANVPMTLSFAFPPTADPSCAGSLSLSSTPAPISVGPGNSITFDTGAPWGGVGLPPDPLLQCNSRVLATM